MKNGTIIPAFIVQVNDTTNRITFKHGKGVMSGISKESVELFSWNGKDYPGEIEWRKIGCHAWPFIQKLHPYHFEQVINADGVTDDQMYSAFNIWVAESFGDGKEVTKLNDAVNHIIIVKGNYNICLPGLWELWSCDHHIKFSLKIQCKNNRFKYEVTDIIINEVGGTTISTNLLQSKSYFSSKKRTLDEAIPRYYAACSGINDFNLMIDNSLRNAVNEYQKKDDW